MTKAWGSKLWDYRKSLGVSRKKFAETLGINEGTLRSYETEARKPGFENFKKINKILEEGPHPQNPKGDEYMNELLKAKDELIASLKRENALLEMVNQGKHLELESSPTYGPYLADIIFDFDIEFNWSLKKPGIKVRYKDDTGNYVQIMSAKLGYTEEEIRDKLMIGQLVNYSEHRIHELRNKEDKDRMIAIVKSYLTAFNKLKMSTTSLIAEIPVSYTAKDSQVYHSMVEYRVNWMKGNGTAHIRWTGGN